MMINNMKRIGLLLLMFSCLAVTLVQCKKDDTPPPPPEPLPKPTAGFNYSRTDSVDFLSYQFKSNSTNYSELLWQFGDDSTSTEVAPSHKYAFEGKYYVKLTTRNADGYSASKEILLDIQDPNFDRTKVGESYFKTVGGILTVSRDNGGGPNAGEGSLKVVDGDINTKFLQSGFAGDLKMTFELDTPKVAGAYTLISANDAPARDPKILIYRVQKMASNGSL